MPPSQPISSPSPISEALPAAHAQLADELCVELRQKLATDLPDLRRKLSPRGLDNFLKGLSALNSMGRGEGPVRAWITSMPEVARTLGEQVLPDSATACLGFASRTSGAVVEQVLLNAPLVARRLDEPVLFNAYLRFLEHLLARAPRALRPMLAHLDELLSALTLGGLRRWADWGARAHRTNYPELERYFSLESEESRAVLKRERKGVLLVDVQRRLAMYLRALWGRDFVMIPTAGDFETREGLRPYSADHRMYLPDALDDWEGISGRDLYRAQTAHLAAHMAVLTAPFHAEGLNNLQMRCIGVIEDARAEAIAIARFPKLRNLWGQFHSKTADGTSGQFDRISRALLLCDLGAEDALCAWARQAFEAMDLTAPQQARDLGLLLAEKMRGLPFSVHHDHPSCPYRCDNRVLWEYEEIDWTQSSASAPHQTRKYVSVSEMVNEVEVETAGDDAQEIWVQASELFDDDGTSWNEKEGKEPLAPPVYYDEFDHTIQMMRPAWTIVREMRPRLGDLSIAADILETYRKVTERLKTLLDAMRPQGRVRIRKLEEGDDLDLNRAVSAAIDLRLRQQPDTRVMMRQLHKTRDTAVMVLLDLSESTNTPTQSGATILELTRSACLLLAEAINRVGDRFAIHGFCSDGRENVFYSRFKDFEQSWDELAKARLSGAEGKLSTRMGAAIRHATTHLQNIQAARKLMIVITDGEPADIDVRDPFYLRHDARHAVDAATRSGIIPFCLTLDPQADQYAQRIFGARNVLVLEKVERLPERLPQLYTRLTR